MKLALVASVIVAAITTLFAVQNAQHTQVSFLAWYFEAPLVILLLITFASGVVTAFLALVPGSVRQSLEIKRLKAKLQTVPPIEAKPPAPVETKPFPQSAAGSEPSAKL
jgi:uncharacterized integral membrane protein